MGKKIIVLLAAGLGRRMQSNIPKVLNKINNTPMIVILLREIFKINDTIEKILIVVGQYKSIIESTLSYYSILNTKIEFIDQEIALGTGHAVLCCRKYLLNYPEDCKILILYGDTPFISIKTMTEMFNTTNIKLLTTRINNPTGFGRIIENNGEILKIVEQKDCSSSEEQINKINTGIYCCRNDLLCNYLPFINNTNNQHEYYLTDIIEIIKIRKMVDIEECSVSQDNHYEILGVNTKEQLKNLEKLYIKTHLE